MVSGTKCGDCGGDYLTGAMEMSLTFMESTSCAGDETGSHVEGPHNPRPINMDHIGHSWGS